MRRSVVLLASICVLAWQACGDDDEQPADSGVDSGASGAGAGGKGGKGGSGGRGGSGGKGGGGGSGQTELQAVTIRFKAKIGDEDLDCSKRYTGLGKTQVLGAPQDFRFFVEQVRLIRSDGEEVPVQFDERAPFQTQDVALIDFTDRKGSCTVGGATVNTTITGKVPAGEYDGVVFVNGVPESLNHQDLTMAKPPLQDASTYWGWVSGYRFIMAGLVADMADPAADGGSPSSGANFVHVGSAACTAGAGMSFKCANSNRNRVRLTGFDPAQNQIVADLSKVFSDINLRDSVQCHGPFVDCKPAYAALGVSLDSGAALDVQTVFRVE